MGKKRLLIGSCVCQSARILEEFLNSLKNLELSGFDATIVFVDDNQDASSSALLTEAADGKFNCETKILPAPPRDIPYQVNETTHFWNDSLVNRVANMKNKIITLAVDEGYDFLFLIDSDLLVEPQLINHLAAQEKDIISEIFWTAWQPDTMPMPNAWLYDKYDMAHPSLEESQRYQIAMEFLKNLRVPGVYEVGGLGACTLISREALKKGINFSPIKNVSFWGEDRWFCIRAAVHGVLLFIDTHFPAVHLYRESDIPMK